MKAGNAGLRAGSAMLAGMLAVLLVAGCVQTGTQEPEAKTELVMAGSGSGLNIMNILEAPFEEAHNDMDLVFLQSTGTGDGVIGVAQGSLDVAAAARKMKDSEKESYPGLAEVTILRDAMVLAVNENVGVTELTSEEILKIHSGEITNWQQVGGRDATIVVLDREESESSKILLREHIFGPNLTIRSDAILMHSADEMDDGIQSTPNSIGQTSMGMIKVKGLTIKPVAVDGVVPSVETVRDGSYKLVRDYGVVYDGESSEPAIGTFVDFLLSEDAGRVLNSYGFVPVAGGA